MRVSADIRVCPIPTPALTGSGSTGLSQALTYPAHCRLRWATPRMKERVFYAQWHKLPMSRMTCDCFDNLKLVRIAAKLKGTGADWLGVSFS